MVRSKKLLAPNGKMHTKAQLNRLNMRQVFDMLIDLDVADPSLYEEFKQISRRSVKRPKYRVIYRKPSPRSPIRTFEIVRPRYTRPDSVMSPESVIRGRIAQNLGVQARILPTDPYGNRCQRMGLVMCPDKQCATSYANCNY